MAAASALSTVVFKQGGGGGEGGAHVAHQATGPHVEVPDGSPGASASPSRGTHIRLGLVEGWK